MIEKVKDGTEYTQLIWVPKHGEYHIAGYLPAEEAVQMLESVQNFFWKYHVYGVPYIIYTKDGSIYEVLKISDLDDQKTFMKEIM